MNILTRLIAAALVALLPLAASAQPAMLASLMRRNTRIVEQYCSPGAEPGAQMVFLGMDFGKDELINPMDVLRITGAITKVELVYSKYPEKSGAAQEALNRNRVKTLEESFPGITQIPGIEWSAVAQTLAPTEAAARDLFHGFAITFVPFSVSDLTEGEVSSMKDKLYTAGIGSPSGDFSPAITVGEIDSSEVYAVSNGDTITLKDIYLEQDSLVHRVLRRNGGWESKVIVQDVTASMTPYNAQVLIWHKLHEKTASITDYIFFNDGDAKADWDKVPGYTGGIYHVRGSNIVEVSETLLRAMESGHGGDGPENNVEALMTASAKAAKGDVVMVADNWATPRDLALWKEVKGIRLHIILCGSAFGVNPEYLTLAKNLRASVHTLEEDLMDLTKVLEGETITIGASAFRLEEGSFVPVLPATM